MRARGSMARYRIYRPVLTNRYFLADGKYSDIDWSDFNQAVEAFAARVNGWFFESARHLQRASGHYAFPVMMINCMLLDMLAMYYYGEEHSTNKLFKKFVRNCFPQWKIRFSRKIRTENRNGNLVRVNDVATALYDAFRNGIFHEGRIKLWGGMSSADSTFSFHSSGKTLYEDGSDCPAVYVDPHRMLDEVDSFFRQYVASLKDQSYRKRRKSFRKKFYHAFGILIGT